MMVRNMKDLVHVSYCLCWKHNGENVSTFLGLLAAGLCENQCASTSGFPEKYGSNVKQGLEKKKILATAIHINENY